LVQKKKEDNVEMDGLFSRLKKVQGCQMAKNCPLPFAPFFCIEHKTHPTSRQVNMIKKYFFNVTAHHN
jgi:hypothetical protein